MDAALCDELLQEIFLRLPPPSSTTISLVSKRFLRLSRSSKSHLSLNLSPATLSHSLSSFLSHFPFLTSLSLSSSNDSLVLSAAAMCPNLRRLRLLSGPVSGFVLVSLSGYCPKLVSLYISISRPFSIQVFSLFRELKELSINFTAKSFQLGSSRENSNFDSTQFEKTNFISAHLDSGLENPDFNSAQFNSSHENPNFSSAQFNSSLEHPNFSSAQLNSSLENPYFNSAQFNSSHENPNFSSTQFNSSLEIPNFNPAELNSSLGNPNIYPPQINLSSIQFSSSLANPNLSSRIRNPSSSSTQFISGLKGPNFDVELQLETLTLSCIRNDDYTLNWLYRSCKKLKKLQFRACEGIGDDPSSSSFISCIKSIEEVELRTCRMIIDVVLLKIAENSKLLKTLLVYDGGCREGLLRFIERSNCNLQKLDLRLPLDLDNRHLSAVAVKFKELKSLRLQSCCLVTGEGLKAVCSNMIFGLEELALINCDVAEREPGLLSTLGQNLKGLKKLDLSYNETMVDKEFVSMIVSCGDLRELKLRGCRGLSSLALVSISKWCKNLECVDLMYCCGIEAKDVELFVLNSPRLRQLEVEENKLSDKVEI